MSPACSSDAADACRALLAGSVILVDGDDTLWFDARYFNRLRLTLIDLGVSSGLDRKTIVQRFRTAMTTTGIGEQGYVATVQELALTCRLSPKVHQILEDAILEFLEHPVEVLPHCNEALSRLNKPRRILWTKGIVEEQVSKLARSGLARYFDDTVVVTHKDASELRQLLGRLGTSADQAVVIGNSLVNDIVPAVEIGGRAIWLDHAENARGRDAEVPQGIWRIAGWFDLLDHLRRWDDEAQR